MDAMTRFQKRVLNARSARMCFVRNVMFSFMKSCSIVQAVVNSHFIPYTNVVCIKKQKYIQDTIKVQLRSTIISILSILSILCNTMQLCNETAIVLYPSYS